MISSHTDTYICRLQNVQEPLCLAMYPRGKVDGGVLSLYGMSIDTLLGHLLGFIPRRWEPSDKKTQSISNCEEVNTSRLDSADGDFTDSCQEVWLE